MMFLSSCENCVIVNLICNTSTSVTSPFTSYINLYQLHQPFVFLDRTQNKIHRKHTLYLKNTRISEMIIVCCLRYILLI